MAKRNIQAFRPKGIRPGHRFYSDDDIEAIIAVAGDIPDGEIDHELPIGGSDGFRHEAHRVPRRQALRERLEQAAHAYTVFSEFQTEPTAKQINDAMADIETAAAKLIAALHLPETMNEDPLASMPAALRFGALQAQAVLEAEKLPKWSGAGLLSDSGHGVYRLQRWARSVHARSRTARQTTRAKRHAGDEELDRLFGGLAGTWIFVFERPIATSVGGSEASNAGEAGGPMIRFFRACLTPVLKDATPSNKAIRARILRLFPGPTARRGAS